MADKRIDAKADKYKGLTANDDVEIEAKPLNFEALLKSGALRVTNRGLPDGTASANPDDGFSLVSGYNDNVEGSQTANWPDNPKAYAVVRDLMANRPQDVGGYKYKQIVESAKDMGLSDKDIYLDEKALRRMEEQRIWNEEAAKRAAATE